MIVEVGVKVCVWLWGVAVLWLCGPFSLQIDSNCPPTTKDPSREQDRESPITGRPFDSPKSEVIICWGNLLDYIFLNGIL